MRRSLALSSAPKQGYYSRAQILADLIRSRGPSFSSSATFKATVSQVHEHYQLTPIRVIDGTSRKKLLRPNFFTVRRLAIDSLRKDNHPSVRTVL